MPGSTSRNCSKRPVLASSEIASQNSRPGAPSADICSSWSSRHPTSMVTVGAPPLRSCPLKSSVGEFHCVRGVNGHVERSGVQEWEATQGSNTDGNRSSLNTISSLGIEGVEGVQQPFAVDDGCL